jgi:hypothetical protein
MSSPLQEKWDEVERGKRKIEGMFQRAMNLRDSSHLKLDSYAVLSLVEDAYVKQYLRAYNTTQDVKAFKQQTQEYRKILRALSL